MAENKIILCDTNILVEFYKNNTEIVNVLKEIGQDNLAISVVTAGEIIQGALNKKELQQLLKDMSQLLQLNIDHSVCIAYKELLIEYSLSHGLRVADAFIAATALVHKCELYTLNKKDFVFIKGLKLYSN